MRTDKEVKEMKTFIYSLTRKRVIKPKEGIQAMTIFLTGSLSPTECVARAAPGWNPIRDNQS